MSDQATLPATVPEEEPHTIPRLRECMFVLPNADNTGATAEMVHRKLLVALSERFGGCTISGVTGAWMAQEGAGVAIELANAFTVAIPEDGQPDFHDIAAAGARMLGQEALYWRDWHGYSHIETITKTPLN